MVERDVGVAKYDQARVRELAAQPVPSRRYCPFPGLAAGQAGELAQPGNPVTEKRAPWSSRHSAIRP